MKNKSLLNYIKLCLQDRYNKENAYFYIWDISNLSINEYLEILAMKDDLISLVNSIGKYIIDFDTISRSIQIKKNK